MNRPAKTPVFRPRQRFWAAWLPAVLARTSIGRATMIADQISTLVTPATERQHGETLQVWASGDPPGPTPTVADANSQIPRAVLFATLPTAGSDMATIVACGWAADWDREDSKIAKIAMRHLGDCFHAAEESWAADGVHLAVWSGDVDEPIGIRAAVGFRDLAVMQYRTKPIEALVPSESSAIPTLRPIDWQDSVQRQRFIELTDRTYDGSADCPAIDPYRNAAATLASYRGNDSYRDHLWFTVIDPLSGRDCGVAIGSIHPASNPLAGELVYIGLVPEMRGRRMSADIVRRVADQMRAAGCGEMWVAHDAANAAAAKLYERLSFRVIYRQRMWFRHFAETAGG